MLVRILQRKTSVRQGEPNPVPCTPRHTQRERPPSSRVRGQDLDSEGDQKLCNGSLGMVGAPPTMEECHLALEAKVAPRTPPTAARGRVAACRCVPALSRMRGCVLLCARSVADAIHVPLCARSDADAIHVPL